MDEAATQAGQAAGTDGQDASGGAGSAATAESDRSGVREGVRPGGGDADQGGTAGGGAATDSDWRSTLPEDLRSSKALADVADVAALAKQHVDLQAHLGNSIRIPSEHASQDDWAAFHAKLRERVPTLGEVDPTAAPPAEPTGYNLPELPTPLDEGFASAYAGWAHEAGLSQAQFEALATRYAALQGEQLAAVEAEKAAGYEALQGDWGSAYKEKTEQAARLAELTDAPPELAEAIRTNQLKPEYLRWLDRIVASIGSEGSALMEGQARTTLTPHEAALQIEEIRNNKDHPWHTAMPGTREREAANAEMRRLYQLKLGQDAGRVHATLADQGPISFEGNV